MQINWLDDSISAGISTILALLISKYFYHKANRDAFKNDILVPISNVLDKTTIKNYIEDREKLYSYGFRTKKDEVAITNLKIASQNLVSYEDAFCDAVWEYFYSFVGCNRTHEVSCRGTAQTYEALNYQESGLKMRQYCGRYTEDGEYDLQSQEELKSNLILFYQYEIGGNAALDKLFSEKNIDEIIIESDSYKNYLLTNKVYDEAFSEIRKLVK